MYPQQVQLAYGDSASMTTELSIVLADIEIYLVTSEDYEGAELARHCIEEEEQRAARKAARTSKRQVYGGGLAGLLLAGA